ncbi:MerR family transcriptional regulator [uncultured Thomasclavelia sp.]|uniref:MerR family transcriptional regulator n=1 Tax=uncultured Thomasclavelia sp. TaxID=3025759 RepID=UPI0025EAB493|nr:MerR family transcriptional regulator [uncultured Thomasclavelia sp.]
MEYTINQVCKKYDLNASTLRYYEKEHLLPPIKKNSSNQRVYNDDDLKWLDIIMCMRKTGMTIAYIRNYIELCKQGDETLEQRFEILKKQKEILTLQQQELDKNIEMINLKIDLYQEKLVKDK